MEEERVWGAGCRGGGQGDASVDLSSHVCLCPYSEIILTPRRASPSYADLQGFYVLAEPLPQVAWLLPLPLPS